MCHDDDLFIFEGLEFGDIVSRGAWLELEIVIQLQEPELKVLDLSNTMKFVT